MASRYLIATSTYSRGPTGLLVKFSEIQRSRQTCQVPTFDVKVDWETGCPIDTLLQLYHGLGPPLGSPLSFSEIHRSQQKKSGGGGLKKLAPPPGFKGKSKAPA